MDAVKAFKDELQSLSDSKPPVTKAKMGAITKAAMKSVKFYKHIVMSVEKFISKCRPEYKVSGLYVIDSIVRQSRHQFGIDKDVYVARFSRNLSVTFNNLFTGCPHEDKSKIVRVLNLWQKNGVFNSQLIQPLLDLAARNPNMSQLPPMAQDSNLINDSPNLSSSLNLSSESNTRKQQACPKYIGQFNFGAASGANNQNYNVKLANSASDDVHSAKHHNQITFSKNMLDFDYDEDDDDGDETPTEAEPPLSSTLSKIEKEQRIRNDTQANVSHLSQNKQTDSLPRNDSDPVLERWNKLFRQQSSITNDSSSNEYSTSESRSTKLPRNKSRSRSRSPVPVLPSSRHSREKPHERPKSPSSPKAKAVKASEQMEMDRKSERARKCLPNIKDGHLTVCSSTLWLGHVPKSVSEADISDAFGEFGSITSINLIPPRGCAYVCMDRRQDAKKALGHSRDIKLNGSHIKMAWAPGKGFKEYKKLKDFWEVDLGCSYIPFSKIDSSIDFEVLEEGGVIDDDSMSIGMSEMRDRAAKEKEDKSKLVTSVVQQQVNPNISLNQLPLPALPMLTQPPPYTLPPNLSIPPPPAAMSRGIPFPPPGMMPGATSIHQPIAPPTNLLEHHHYNFAPVQASQSNANAGAGISGSGGAQTPNSALQMTAHDPDSESVKSPNSIDQQLSMTERQINLVEQQLSLMRQARNLPPPPTSMAAPLLPQTIFHQTQLNPLIFDMPPPQMMANIGGTGQMLDQHQMQIFANSALLAQQSTMLPLNQAANMNPAMGGHSMQPFGDGY